MLLTATALGQNPNALTLGLVIQGVSWTAQFLGHGLAEKRAPALLDNLLGGMYNLLCRQYIHPNRADNTS